MSTDLLSAFRPLQTALIDSSSEYVQVIFTDMDIFLSEPEETTKMLRDWIGAFDTTLPNRWSAPLKFVLATVGTDLREIHFPYPKLMRAAISGYV